jgi:biotin operon repressor
MESKPRSLQWLERLWFPQQFFSTAVGLIAAWYILDIEFNALVGVVIGTALATLWPLIKRRYEINRGWGKLPLGLGLVGLGVYAFTISGGMDVLKAGFVLSGAWLTLDGLYDLRTEAGATTTGTSNPIEQFGDAAIVGNTLDDEPHSVDELGATLDLSRSRIEGALDMLTDANAVVERNDRYVAQENQSLSQGLRDVPTQATDRFYDLPDRLLRPLRLFSD